MLNIFEFIRKYYFLLLFLFIELIAISLTGVRQTRPNAFFVNSSNFISSIVYNNFFKVTEYFSLKTENNKLLQENRFLKKKGQYNHESVVYYTTDSIRKVQFDYFSAKVIKNSILSKNNFITINKGYSDGVVKDMGVVSPNGVVGIVTNVSKNFCLALSVLNSLNSVGCKLKNSNYFGAASWNGKNYQQIVLNGIPNHVMIEKGDTVVTSGYGYIFPADINVGIIDTFWKNSDNNFYTIKLNLTSDLKQINNVYLIRNTLLKEQTDLEEQTLDFM